MSDYLEVIVLSSGCGESVLLRMPGNQWGVIDAYTPDLRDADANPVLSILKQEGVESLAFLCMTHPHEDHFRGLPQVYKAMRVREFWRFAAFADADFDSLQAPGVPEESVLLALLRQEAGRDIDPAHARERQDALDHLSSLLAQVRRDCKRKRDPCTLRTIVGLQHLYPFPRPAEADNACIIESVAPSPQDKDEYEAPIRRAVAGARDGPPLQRQHHNRVSAGIRVRWGNTRLVLGADMEDQSWRRCVPLLADDEWSAQCVKVSHHGSTNGYCTGLWSRLSSKQGTLAIVTPFFRHRLPDDDALRHISGFAREVLVTCTKLNNLQEHSQQLRTLPTAVAVRAAFKTTPIPTSRGGGWRLKFNRDGDCVERHGLGSAFVWQSHS